MNIMNNNTTNNDDNNDEYVCIYTRLIMTIMIIIIIIIMLEWALSESRLSATTGGNRTTVSFQNFMFDFAA